MAITKKEGDGEHPSDHYLIVEDPETVSTWHLRVRGTDGKPDHRLMGAAWAALHGGYRGNKYEGPGKEEALSRLKALYKNEGMDEPGEADGGDAKLSDTEVLCLLADLSFDAKQQLVMAALLKRFPPEPAGNQLAGSGIWITRCYDDRVVFNRDGKNYRVSYAIDGDTATLGDDETEVMEGDWVPVSSATMSDVKNSMIKIAVAYTGKFKKVEGGKLQDFIITDKDLEQIDEKLTDRETPIDYDHLSAVKAVPPGWARAAGWFQPVKGEIKPFGTDEDGVPRKILYHFAEFTAPMLKMIKDKEYRYFSPEPHWQTLNEKGKNTGTSIAAGAMTNRPFLKDLPPIEIDSAQYPQLLEAVALSEFDRDARLQILTEKEQKSMAEETEMKKFKLRKLSDGEHKGKVGAFAEDGKQVGFAERDGAPPSISFKHMKDGEHAGKVGCFDGDDMVGLAHHASLKAAAKKLNEIDGDDDEDEAKKMEAKKLADQDRSNSLCLSELSSISAAEFGETVEEMMKKSRLTTPGYGTAMQINRVVDGAISKGKFLPKQRKALFSLGISNIEALNELVAGQRKVVDTETRGIAGADMPANIDEQIEQGVHALMSENKSLEYGDALRRFCKENPEVWEAHERRKPGDHSTAAR